jgi:hypothetical protein
MPGSPTPSGPSPPPAGRFDGTDWPTNVELRIRCMGQLHTALVEHVDELRALTIAEVGATRP